jgi:CRP-like cAMP-binding protein
MEDNHMTDLSTEQLKVDRDYFRDITGDSPEFFNRAVFDFSLTKPETAKALADSMAQRILVLVEHILSERGEND